MLQKSRVQMWAELQQEVDPGATLSLMFLGLEDSERLFSASQLNGNTTTTKDTYGGRKEKTSFRIAPTGKNVGIPLVPVCDSVC